ncbi:hypothetical protein [Dysgonomonas sp. 521]|uniref:hypothetical protein n=1 Tax=Dysgonomonas sp. 521 TaxID=2302932 RepID=UPI0013D1476F|nr:hypothetical protein [Dysgonomonas sp. 521]
MKKQEQDKPDGEFIAYEEARIKKAPEAAERVTDKEVESSNELLSPDENTWDRG